MKRKWRESVQRAAKINVFRSLEANVAMWQYGQYQQSTVNQMWHYGNVANTNYQLYYSFPETEVSGTMTERWNVRILLVVNYAS